MPLGALSQAWTTAVASCPAGWRVMHLSLEMVEPDGTQHWLAGACLFEDGSAVDYRGDEFYERGHGPTPHQALDDLARKLAEIRGSANG